jgi:hypothetical protein
MKNISLLAFFALMFAQCSAQPTIPPANTPAQPTTQAAAQPTALPNKTPKSPEQLAAENEAFQRVYLATEGTEMPSITNEKMQYLFQNLQGIDYIFYDQDFTVSSDAANAKGNLMYISTKSAKKLPNQKPIGRAYYAANGDIALDAEVYFGASQIEQYMVFVKDGKPYAANYISPQGVSFFKQVVNARIEAQPKK